MKTKQLLNSGLINISQLASQLEMSKQALTYHIRRDSLPEPLEKKIIFIFTKYLTNDKI